MSAAGNRIRNALSWMPRTVVSALVLGVGVGVAGRDADAQTMPGTGLAPPPLKRTVDSHGVDLVSGTASLPGMRVSIGSKESGIERDPGREWDGRDNLTGTLNELTVASHNQEAYELPLGTYIMVSFGDISEMFQQSGTAYLPFSGATGTLSCTSSSCDYTAKDGTVALFNKGITNGYLNGWANKGLLTQITRPDGEIVSISYITNSSGTSVISSASSSLGWMIKYQYSGNGNSGLSIKAINTAVEYCDPARRPAAG